MKPIVFSIVVLTYNRREVSSELLEELRSLQHFETVIIVVDNCSSGGTSCMVREKYPACSVVETGANLGAVDRNEGMKVARGQYIVTIDDDILGMNDDSLTCLQSFFEQNASISAIWFKVLDHYNGTVCNWCHPHKLEEGADLSFESAESSEGAVAFRKSLLDVAGLYTQELFICHEGADLAARILDNGLSIYYLPQVVVTHKYTKDARSNWRRYYYDTRNDFWLVVKSYRLIFLLAHLGRRLSATLVYSLRDGFFKYWLKTIRDSLLDLPEMLRQRKPIAWSTHERCGRSIRTGRAFSISSKSDFVPGM